MRPSAVYSFVGTLSLSKKYILLLNNLCALLVDYTSFWPQIILYLKIKKTVALKFKRYGKISELKAFLCKKEGISESHQQLFFFSGNQLKDDQRLLDYGIQQGSTLHLVSQDLAGMKIYVRLPSDQRTIAVEVKACDIIQNIKSIIQAKEGIPSYRYTLIYDGKLLEDNGILASLNISNESTLHLVFNPKDVIQIYVGVGTEEIVKLEVKLVFTIHDVKAIIGGMIGVPVNDWDLVYAGNKLTGCKTLASYGIEEGTGLKMFPAMIQIFVKTWSDREDHYYLCTTSLYHQECQIQDFSETEDSL